MGALTKAQMADRLFEELGLNKREAKEIVEMFFEEVRGALERNEQSRKDDEWCNNGRADRGVPSGASFARSSVHVVERRWGSCLCRDCLLAKLIELLHEISPVAEMCSMGVASSVSSWLRSDAYAARKVEETDPRVIPITLAMSASRR